MVGGEITENDRASVGDELTCQSLDDQGMRHPSRPGLCRQTPGRAPPLDARDVDAWTLPRRKHGLRELRLGCSPRGRRPPHQVPPPTQSYWATSITITYVLSDALARA